MIGLSTSRLSAGVIAIAMIATPSLASAQSYYGGEPSVVVECGAGQRAVMENRVINGRTQVVARCEAARSRVVYDEYGRAVAPVGYTSYRPVQRRSTVQYVERAPRRTKTKTALTIAGSAATGAGLGGIVKGKKGALIGAALGGGVASIYDAAKRR